ncbi:hypothetical protein F3Y22_tig00111071pilonHSYRG00012 [Hibiscus syriacus]|uniref:RNase H type-1 domain-containing protein n=1 Tax=Hibiscus syriacus TaxID=106335 RepID=A0A6A2Z393_HIBSY|nr:hypothetical protein F3Y22_tig00111071pilonHSYRG00012 [Hibiscus syriacus]
MALGNRWGHFAGVDTVPSNKDDLLKARVIVRAASPFDVPSSFNSRGVDIQEERVAPMAGTHRGEIKIQADGSVLESVEGHKSGASPSCDKLINYMHGTEKIISDEDMVCPINISGPNNQYGLSVGKDIAQTTINSISSNKWDDLVVADTLEDGLESSCTNSSKERVPESPGNAGAQGGISSQRRVLRRLIRESINDPNCDTSDEGESSPTCIEDEALVVWEMSKKLGIVFKGGKEAVLKRIHEIKEDSRGVGSQRKSRAVKRVIRQHNPMVVLLQETKLENIRSSLLWKMWNRANVKSIFFPSCGAAGGLVCLWNDDAFVVSNQFTFQRFTAVISHLKYTNFLCGVVNVYGPVVEAEKIVLSREEKRGLAANLASMECFRNFIQDALLSYLPLKGGSFTWSNLRDNPTLVRLDRFLVSGQVLSMFPNLEQVLLEKSISDHNAIALVNEGCNWGPKPFKFFNYMIEEDGFSEMIIDNFKKLESKRRVGVMKLLKGSKTTIKTWSGDRKIGLNKSIEELEGNPGFRKKKIESGLADSGSFDSLSKVRENQWKELRIEERAWLQKSRLRWFEEGDCNTRFFLIGIKQARVNLLKVINVEDRTITNPGDIRNYVLEFFAKAYNSKCSIEVESDIISGSQFAFIPGRQILDCSFLANECIDEAIRRKSSGLVFKVDKLAYDTVDWNFLIKVMEEKNFGNRWCNWILRCISTASIAVLVNGSPTNRFEIVRRLRQGCSLSAMLFNIVGETLSLMLSKAAREGLFSGFLVGAGGRLGKLGVKWVLFRLNTWAFQSVEGEIPQLFGNQWMPATVHRKPSSLMSIFLWGGTSEKQKLHWVKWTSVCKPKAVGGLGIADLEVQNRALLGKWIWKYANEKGSLWQRVMKLNVDGATSRNGLTGGIGGIFRNSDGLTLGLFSEPIGRTSPVLAELSPLKHGLDLFFSPNAAVGHNLIVEGDCKLVIIFPMSLHPSRFCYGIFPELEILRRILLPREESVNYGDPVWSVVGG